MSTSQGVNVSDLSQCARLPLRATIRLLQAILNLPQVLRYSALLFGIFYGFSHQRTITANNKASHVEHEYKHKESLIEKAKLEWKKKNLPPEAKTASGGGQSYSQPVTHIGTDRTAYSHYRSGRQELRPGGIFDP